MKSRLWTLLHPCCSAQEVSRRWEALLFLPGLTILEKQVLRTAFLPDILALASEWSKPQQ
jgi:hypothetical protein